MRGDCDEAVAAMLERALAATSRAKHNSGPECSLAWNAWCCGALRYHPDGAVIDYGAAKAALLNLTKALSQELGPKRIRLNSVSPGPVETALWLGHHGVAETVAAATGVDAAVARERIVAGMGGIPSGRFTKPDEVATLVALLASERTANVSGANFVIDGGLIKTT